MHGLFDRFDAGSRPHWPSARGPKPEQSAASLADFTGPAPGGGRLALRGAFARVPSLDGETSEKVQAAPKATQRAEMGNQEREQCDEIVCLRHGKAKLHKQRFEVLLSRLLAVEADGVMQGSASARELAGGEKIGLGLSHPFRGQPLHTGHFLWR